MGKAKNPSQAVIDEAIIMAMPVTKKLIAAEQEIEGLKADVKYAEAAADRLADAVNQLSKSLEDMRKQRDRAVDEAERERFRARSAENNLSRAMGWVDAKMDKPPLLGDAGEWPF